MRSIATPTSRLRREDAAPRRYGSRGIVLGLAAVLALEAADRGAVGALGPSIERAFGIGHTDLGLIATAVTIVAAAGTVPAGFAVDRVRRLPLLAWAVLLWAVAMAVAATATSFAVLLGARMFLGGVTAVAYPAVASLTGDLFPARLRGRKLGTIRTGEMVGLAVSVTVAGAVVAFATWRLMFWLLAASAVVLFAVLRRFPEPARGGDARERGEDPSPPGESRPVDAVGPDPRAMTAMEVARYILTIRTNVLLMLGGSLGDFFFSGLQIFLVSFVIHQYDVQQSAAALLVPVVGAGAFAGLLLGGRVGDRRREQGHASRASGRGGVRVHRRGPRAAAAALPALGARRDPLHGGRGRVARGADPDPGRVPARHRASAAVGPGRGDPHHRPHRSPGRRPRRVRRARGPPRRRRTGRTAARVPRS